MSDLMSMWLHILYILAFTVIAFLAIGNLIRSMFTLGIESQRMPAGWAERNGLSESPLASHLGRSPQHPEMLDDKGKVINEPLLVMRSMSVEDARERLDAIYRSSPGGESDTSESSDS